MHRTGKPWPALLTGLMVLLVGCAAFPSQDGAPRHIRRIFVREPERSFTEEMRRCGEASHDAAVRRLRTLGYQDATEEDGADATLEGVWVSEPFLPEDGRARVSLRLTLKARSGEALFTTQVAGGTLLSFLSKDRVADETARQLSGLGKAPLVR